MGAPQTRLTYLFPAGGVSSTGRWSFSVVGGFRGRSASMPPETYLFPAGATPRRPAEAAIDCPLGHHPCRRDAIRSAPTPTGPPARSRFRLRRSGCWSGHGRRDHCTASMARDQVSAGGRAAPPCVASPAAAPRRRPASPCTVPSTTPHLFRSEHIHVRARALAKIRGQRIHLARAPREPREILK